MKGAHVLVLAIVSLSICCSTAQTSQPASSAPSDSDGSGIPDPFEPKSLLPPDFAIVVNQTLAEPAPSRTDLCLTISRCSTECKTRVNQNLLPKWAQKPEISSKEDFQSRHIACCSSGCNRRSTKTFAECVSSCANSPWVENVDNLLISPNSNTSSVKPEVTNVATSAKDRRPSGPTFLQLSEDVSLRSHSSKTRLRRAIKHQSKVEGKSVSHVGSKLEAEDQQVRKVQAAAQRFLASLTKDGPSNPVRTSKTSPEQKKANLFVYHRNLCMLGCYLRCPVISQDMEKPLD